MTKPVLSILILIIAVLIVGVYIRNSQSRPAKTPAETKAATETTTPTSQKREPTRVFISNELQEYAEDNFNFSFSYPKSLTFERQTPYPGWTIKALGLRVDGLTESQLLSKDLQVSLKSNDLYYNLDDSRGEAVCSNKKVEAYTNANGTAGYIIEREKTFYDEENGEPKVFQDMVYAFPIKEKNQPVSSYKALVFTIKWPSQENLKILKQIADSVKTY